MENDKIIRMITEKCDVYYDDALLSKEKILEKYLLFFAKQINSEERTVSFAFHTGSLCFDAASVVAVVIGCLAYGFSSNDEILAELEPGKLVLFRKERYRWMGTERKKQSADMPEMKYAVLMQDAKGKNGPSTAWIPYEANKHLIKPYNGNSSITDGRGLRKDNTNRNDFIADMLDIPLVDVPTILDVSVVIVADKTEFIELCKHIKIRYGDGKFVGITDIVPVSYFTNSGESMQIGKNQSKAEPVIKVASTISTARELVLDRTGNKVIGILIMGIPTSEYQSTELSDILRRKSLKFAYVTSSFSDVSCESVINQYEDAKLFACIKELLSSSTHEIQSYNRLTAELNRQINNIISRELHSVEVEGLCGWDAYRNLKENLFAIKQCGWSNEDKDSFVLSAMALINLFSIAFFDIKTMERAICNGELNATVVSPKARITELQEIVDRNVSMKDQAQMIVAELTDWYLAIYEKSPKAEALANLLKDTGGKKAALVVPKAYYTELFKKWRLRYEVSTDVDCITANRFDRKNNYDIIISVGDITGKRFDAIQCVAATDIWLLLYDFEQKTFAFRKRKSENSERKLNARIKGLSVNEFTGNAESNDSNISEQTVCEFSDLDAYVESAGSFDVRKFVGAGNGTCDGNFMSEVNYVGTFTDGERILFSKYYSAVIFDPDSEEVSEKSPDKLLPGDVLVFTKNDDYTKNIVDRIFDQLTESRKLDPDVQEAAVKAFYWKEILREYKEKNELTYTALANQLKKLGSRLQTITVRQWLADESHIVGPRDAKTIEQIAKLTQDPYLLADPEGHFEACRTIRYYRRKILALIAQAINDKLSNKEPAPGSAFEVVYENVDRLSETLELDNISRLDETVSINNNMVNRPITDSEVFM